MIFKNYLLRVQKLRREEGGVAAMEFALLAPVFFLLLFGIIEVSLVFFSDMMLQNAMLDSARLIRTGYAAGKIDPAATMDSGAFVQKVCQKAFILNNCASKLKYKVEVLTNYNAYQTPIAVGNSAGLTKIDNSYNIGVAEDIMLVRTYYQWNLFTGFIRDVFSTPGTNVRIIGGGVVFRNEPYN